MLSHTFHNYLKLKYYKPAPKDPPKINVIFGTYAVLTAETNFAPCLAIPSCSYFFPTINPVMFYKKIKGIFLCVHI